MVALREEFAGNYSRSIIVRGMNDDVIRHARRIFVEYKLRGVMVNDSFDDDVWKISDEKSMAKLMNFSLRGHTIAPWLESNEEEFRLCVKTYIALCLGEFTPFTLQDVARHLFRLPYINADGVIASDKYPNQTVAFLRLLPGGSIERDRVIEHLADREPKAWQIGFKAAQRVLADFKSYLRFDDAIKGFWLSASADERLFYFPLYFWWNLTAILPLRVTEFLLTPRDCLAVDDGKWSLTIRRSKLKSGGKKIAYRVGEDYAEYKYEITGAMGRELREYIEATSDMGATLLGTLFLTEPHCRYLNDRSSPRNRRYYSYQDLSACMQLFFEEVIVPCGAEIGAIKLGDTRHLAMVNLIISGGSPVICRELAVHADIGISSHYYTNIDNLVLCATVERLRKQRGGAEAIITGERKYALSRPAASHRVLNGFCISEAYQKHDIRDCLKAVGIGGQIGECVACPFFHPDDQGLRFAANGDSAARSAVKADSLYLMQMVDIVRKGLGNPEDIGAALLRLQHSSNRYSLNIQESYDYGKTQKT